MPHRVHRFFFADLQSGSMRRAEATGIDGDVASFHSSALGTMMQRPGHYMEDAAPVTTHERRGEMSIIGLTKKLHWHKRGASQWRPRLCRTKRVASYAGHGYNLIRTLIQLVEGGFHPNER